MRLYEADPNGRVMNTDRLLVDAVFPDRTVESMSVSAAGNFKRTVAVWFEHHEPVVLQCSSENSLRTEGELARAIRERTSVPVPAVIAIGSHGSTSYVVSELASGENLHGRFAGLDRAVQERIAGAFGRHLAELHEAFAFDGFGGITCASGRDRKAFRASGAPDFSTWFRHYAREGIDALPAEFDRLRDDLYHAIQSIPDPEAGDPVLYPWDLRPGNALIEDAELSAVVDWGDPLAAPAGLAAAKAEYLTTDWYVADADPLRTAFREGYESVRPYPDVPSIYRLVAVLRSAVDSNGVVTRPRYPEWTGEDAVEFHRSRMRELLRVGTPA
jgi:fructosamine-3-kinase